MIDQDQGDTAAEAGHNSGAELADQLEAIKSPEKTTEQQLADLRSSLAEKAGVTVSAEPTKLDANQRASVAEKNFGKPDEVIAKAHSTIEASRTGLGAFKSRLDRAATSALASSTPERGKVIPLLTDADPLAAKSDAGSSFAELDRANAMNSAFNLLLRNETDGAKATISERALQNASIDSYALPENGSPIIDQRMTELPNGTIYEINVHGAGSDKLLSTQVAVVPK